MQHTIFLTHPKKTIFPVLLNFVVKLSSLILVIPRMALSGGILLVQTMMAMSLVFPAMGTLPLIELTLYATISTPNSDGVLAPASVPISPASSESTSSIVLVPNTFIVIVGNQLKTSLLTSGNPVLFWAVVQASDIANACEHIVTRGQLNINTTINDEQRGTTTYMMMQVLSVGSGCLDVSGGTDGPMDSSPGSELLVQFSAVANGRKALVVCPSNDAQETGCAVYLIGSDIEALSNQSSRSQVNELSSIQGAPSRLHTHRLDCPDGAEDGVIRGIVTGIFAAENCAGLGPRLAPFCIAGVMGVYAMMGAFNGCVSSRSSCFPGDAVVFTRGQHPKLMSELRLGDEVAVWRPRSAGHGDMMSTAYAEIYAFGHKDANATAVFLEIFVSPIATDNDNGNEDGKNLGLRISPMHFVPTLLPSSKSSSGAPSHDSSNMYRISSSSSKQLPMGTVVYKRAQDVNVGDVVWALVQRGGHAHDMGVVPCIVQDISIKRMQGLYNPFTMGGGTIIVDGVVASVHSPWFLDSFFDNLGITHLLPSTYQLILSPIRLLYTMMGKELYVPIYEWLDAWIDISMFGINYGGTFVLSSVFAVVTSSTFLVLRQSK